MNEENKPNVSVVQSDGNSSSIGNVVAAAVTPKMSKQAYNPPEFINDASEYPEYKRRLKRWSRITKVDKSQQAEVVVYLLEKHPSGIQDKINTALGDKIVG